MDKPRRTHAQARAEMRRGILRLGNDQLRKVGAAGLSVREIARGLGVASSAIYRHVASRDELLTLLIVDAYTDLADAVDAALVAAGADEAGPGSGERLGRLAGAMRAWAVAHPERWALTYGSPVPGYAAPAEQTTGPGTRVMVALLGILLSGGDGNAARPGVHELPPPSPGLQAEVAAGAAEFGLAGDPTLGVDAILAWSALVGLISMEVFQGLGPELATHGEELLERWIAVTARDFGLS